jgi:hypothetical protein
MKMLLKRFALLLSSMTCVSAYLVLPASADSTADVILNLKCQGGYNVNVWKRYDSGELLYRSTSPQGNLSLGRGTRDDTGAVRAYEFRNGNYVYQALSDKGDHQGLLSVYQNGHLLMQQACTRS